LSHKDLSIDHLGHPSFFMKSQVLSMEHFFCPIPWQLVTVPSHGISTKLVIRSTLYRVHE